MRAVCFGGSIAGWLSSAFRFSLWRCLNPAFWRPDYHQGTPPYIYSRESHRWKEHAMSFPYSESSFARDALIFTIPSGRVVAKIEQDAKSSTNLRVQTAARLIRKNMNRVDALLSQLTADIIPIYGRSELLVTLFLSPQQRPQTCVQSIPPESPPSQSTQALQPSRGNRTAHLDTILEEEESETLPCEQRYHHVLRLPVRSLALDLQLSFSS